MSSILSLLRYYQQLNEALRTTFKAEVKEGWTYIGSRLHIKYSASKCEVNIHGNKFKDFAVTLYCTSRFTSPAGLVNFILLLQPKLPRYREKSSLLNFALHMAWKENVWSRFKKPRTWSKSEDDLGSSTKTTFWADEKSKPTPPAVIPIIATFTYLAESKITQWWISSLQVNKLNII